VIGKITSLAEPLGIPYIPITPTFPLLGPLGLLPVPTKWTIRFGAPLTVPMYDLVEPSSSATMAAETDDEAATAALAEHVRKSIDGMIAELLAERRSIIFG
jgi:hypothetical protein